MGFNAEAYRKEAKALGLSDDQIEQDIAEETGGHTGAFSDPTAESVDLNKDKTVPGWLQAPLGAVGIGLAGAAGKSIYDRYIKGGNQPPNIPPNGGQGLKIEPMMDVNQKPPSGRIEPTWDVNQAIQEANNVAANVKPTKQVVPITSIKQSDLDMIAASEKAKLEKEVSASAKKPPANTPQKPVDPTKVVPPISSNPEELALTKSQQSAKGWLEGQWGKGAPYYKAVQDIFGGVPPTYTSEKGQHAIGQESHQKVLDYRKENIAGPKVNLTYDMKKELANAPSSSAARATALAGLLALPAFVNAAQGGKERDVQKAAGSLMQGVTSFLGPLGAIAGELFGISPEELDTLRKAEAAKKSKQGIAPTVR